MENLARTFKALSDTTRLKMLALLQNHAELCVCDFEAVLDIPHSKASRHLRYLLNAGFVKDRRQNVWVHYHIPKDINQDGVAALKALKKMIPENEIAGLERRYKSWMKRKNPKDFISTKSSKK